MVKERPTGADIGAETAIDFSCQIELPGWWADVRFWRILLKNSTDLPLALPFVSFGRRAMSCWFPAPRAWGILVAALRRR
jgi:hypothetical protein